MALPTWQRLQVGEAVEAGKLALSIRMAAHTRSRSIRGWLLTHPPAATLSEYLTWKINISINDLVSLSLPYLVLYA